MQKLLFIILISAIICFYNQGKYGHGGFMEDVQIMQHINWQIQQNHDLVERNNQMIMQISGLKGSTDSIEQRSRSELNMIKSGETLVILPGNDTGEKK